MAIEVKSFKHVLLSYALVHHCESDCGTCSSLKFVHIGLAHIEFEFWFAFNLSWPSDLLTMPLPDARQIRKHDCVFSRRVTEDPRKKCDTWIANPEKRKAGSEKHLRKLTVAQPQHRVANSKHVKGILKHSATEGKAKQYLSLVWADSDARPCGAKALEIVSEISNWRRMLANSNLFVDVFNRDMTPSSAEAEEARIKRRKEVDEARVYFQMYPLTTSVDQNDL